MSADCTSKPIAVGTSLAITALMAIASGCADQDKQRADRIAAIVNADQPSTNHLLLPDDLQAFRPGRAKEEVLEDLRWRGNFGMAAKVNETNVTSITYKFVLPQEGDSIKSQGDYLFAIFVDDKFEKFVKPPRPRPEDIEIVDHQGTPARRPKPIKVGDMTWFVRALEGEPVDFEELEMDLKARPEPPSRIDPGLTAVYLLLGGTRFRATEEHYKRNAELRDQFNASRLKLGMSQKEVEAAFKTKPIESGKVEAGQYRIYGSNEAFNIDMALHFSNVLVVFQDGRATQIRSAGAGDGWRLKLQQRYLDLPPPKDMR